MLISMSSINFTHQWHDCEGQGKALDRNPYTDDEISITCLWQPWNNRSRMIRVQWGGATLRQPLWEVCLQVAGRRMLSRVSANTWPHTAPTELTSQM